MGEQRRCLVVGLVAEHERFRAILAALGDQVVLVDDGVAAQALTDRQSFDLIAIEYPTPGRTALELLKAIRWSESKSREAVVVLVTTPDFLEEAEDLHEAGVTRILNRGAKDAVLKIAFHEVTRSEVRHPIKAFVRIPGPPIGQPGTVMAQTVNVSTTGMLVRMSKEVLVGARFDFVLQITQLTQPIRGIAEVVRIMQGPGDRVTGFAATFNKLEGNDAAILASFIARQPRP